MLRKLLSAPKRLLARGLKREKVRLSLIYIDSDKIPTGGRKAIADKEAEYLDIYTDPYLFK